jgi:3,4-dihydroxy 2-butanone 4-phosphate synthase/GTP cyclohydrolase II
MERTPRDMDELRDYGVGAQILAELGVHDMILLTNTQHSLIALDGYGLRCRPARDRELRRLRGQSS